MKFQFKKSVLIALMFLIVSSILVMTVYAFTTTRITMDVGDTEYLKCTSGISKGAYAYAWISHDINGVRVISGESSSVCQIEAVGRTVGSYAIIRCNYYYYERNPYNNQLRVCSGAEDYYVTVNNSPKSVTVDERFIYMETGDELDVDATVYPAGVKSCVIWESSDPSIVSVENYTLQSTVGTVTAKKAGTVTLTANLYKLDSYGNCGSYVGKDSCTVSVSDPPILITKQPATACVAHGETATFGVEMQALGTGITYKWQYRPSSDGEWVDAEGEGCETPSLTVIADVEKTKGSYRCVIKDSEGNTAVSDYARLLVTKITEHPKDVLVRSEDDAVFSAAVVGQALNHTWYYRTSADDEWEKVSSDMGAGALTPILTLHTTNGMNGYEFRCEIRAYNFTYFYTEAAMLTVVDKDALLNGWEKLNGKWYFFGENGMPQTGWVQTDGKWYYTGDSGVMQTGWILFEGRCYYLNADGSMQTEWKKIDGEWYYFGAYGVKQVGWISDGRSWYYTDEDGKMLTGWLTLGDSVYYLDVDGVMASGVRNIDGKLYAFSESGALERYSGWKKINGEWYFFGNDSEIIIGWISDGELWYYSNTSGVMQTGWIHADGNWYYMNMSGVMQTGWVHADGNWYYMNSSGVMKTGWVQVGGNWYYMNVSGVMQTGWVQVGDNWYYCEANGSMVCGKTVVIEGKPYTFNGSGALIP